MATLTNLLSPLLVAALMSGCAGNTTDENYPGTLKQQSAADFADAPECDAETSCEAGLTCIAIDATNFSGAICVDAATICDALDCGDGECLVLESYPAQLTCGGDYDGGDGDGDGDDVVCNTPTGACPPGTGGGDDGTVCSDPDPNGQCPGDHGEGTSPGNPGGDDDGEGTSPGNPGGGDDGEGASPGNPGDGGIESQPQEV